MLAPDQHPLRVFLCLSSPPMTIACPRSIAASEAEAFFLSRLSLVRPHCSLRWFGEGVIVEMTRELKDKEERKWYVHRHDGMKQHGFFKELSVV